MSDLESYFWAEWNYAQRMIAEAEKRLQPTETTDQREKRLAEELHRLEKEKMESEKTVREEARIAAVLQDKLWGQFEALSRGLKLSGRG
jgi:hypothetical protein